MTITVREFIRASYALITAHSPTVPLHGDDLSVGIRVLNQLLQSYASTGLKITISRTETIPIFEDRAEITCGPPGLTPPADIQVGRLANLENAWLLLNGVDYPMIIESRSNFLAAWKYNPLKSIPRFIMVFPEVDVTRLRIYPAASQFFEFFLRGKFQLPPLDANDDMGIVPDYYHRYLSFAVARDVAMYTGRADAWTAPLEQMYQAEKDVIISASEVNLAINAERDSLLNGAWAVRSGIT